MIKLIRALLILSILLPFSAMTADRDNTAYIKEMSYYLSPESNDAIETPSFDQFKLYKGKSPNFGFFKGTVWLKIAINHSNEKTLLEVKNANIDQISLYTHQAGKYELQEVTGDLFPFKHRKINHRFFHFNVSTIDTVLLKINNNGKQLFVPVSVFSNDYSATRDSREKFLFGLYYGLCLFALILNLFIFSRIREKSTLMYLLYLVSLIALQLSMDGQGFEYLWSESPTFTNHAPPIFASLSIYFLTFFTQSFLNTKQYSPKGHSLLTFISYIVLINLLISVIPATHHYAIISINIITLLFNLLILPIAFIIYKKNFRPARYFLLAFIFLIFSAIVFILRNFGVLPSSFLTDYSLQIGSFLEVTLLTFAIVDRFKSFKVEAVNRLEELNKLQAEQNQRLEIEVRERTEEINQQKKLIETKNKETLDSINYAKRIQTALIPSEDSFKSLFKDAFTLWKPKDIVSGDFYWGAKVTANHDTKDKQPLTVFCVGDCTGHGVPGAIISVIGLKLLNLSVSNRNINSTSEALDFLQSQFKKTFQNESNNYIIRDGMDVSICAIDDEKNKLYFSGARNGVYIVRKSKLFELKGDKQSIGDDSLVSNFTQHSFDLEKGDYIYLYTDGYADQFGGPKGKKFKYKPLKDLIIEHSKKPMEEQKAILNQVLSDWSKDTEQTDDICLVGVQF